MQCAMVLHPEEEMTLAQAEDVPKSLLSSPAQVMQWEREGAAGYPGDTQHKPEQHAGRKACAQCL